MWKVIDYTGNKFGRWTVLYRATNRGRHAVWHCKCECGTEKDITAASLRGGSTSCGCYFREVVTKHGGSGSAEYSVWQNMRRRCNDPSNEVYPYYGGRGIRICKRWNDFANFYADMGVRPAGRSLDRIDNNGNYEPSNCRWATLHEQAVNQRPRTLRKQCRRGHDDWYSPPKGGRRCRPCNTIAHRAYKQRCA